MARLLLWGKAGRLRKLADNSQNIQGSMATHSVGGGTGSGMGMLILERLAVDYRKKSKIGFEIYPSPNISSIKLLFLCGHLKVDNLWAIKVTFLDRIRSFTLKSRWGLLDRRYGSFFYPPKSGPPPLPIFLGDAPYVDLGVS